MEFGTLSAIIDTEMQFQSEIRAGECVPDAIVSGLMGWNPAVPCDPISTQSRYSH